MTAIEIIALITAALILIKLLVVWRKPSAWMRVSKAALRETTLTKVIYGVLILVVGGYIFSAFSIVDFMAVTALVSLLVGFSFLFYSKEFGAVARNLMKQKGLLKRAWPTVVIWLLLSLWTLQALFI